MSRAIYAQSSDIKARDFASYRFDMKKKAIAELETLDWLRGVLRQKWGDGAVVVEKHGGDKHVWFARDGKINREPDYRARSPNGKREMLFEFQYAEKADLKFFDFKLSKVGVKRGGLREPHKDREFLYILKPEAAGDRAKFADGGYAFLSPSWIMKNGEEGNVPAWGNRRAYRVKREVFLRKAQAGDAKLSKMLNAIARKNSLLEYQRQFIENEKSRLASRLERVVDDKEALKIAANSLHDFYFVCLLMERLEKTPANLGLWLAYLQAAHMENARDSREFAQYVSAFAFLYFSLPTNPPEAELQMVAKTLEWAFLFVERATSKNGLFDTSPRLSPAEEIRHMLFAINLLEDILQDARHYFALRLSRLSVIRKIFQTTPNCEILADYLQRHKLT